MSKFKTGDRVKISKNSEYYIGTPCNPINCSGLIDFIFPGGPYLNIGVKWDNGLRNVYGEVDLDSLGMEVFAEKSPIKPVFGWAVELDGKLFPDAYPSREFAREVRREHLQHPGVKKAVVRKVKIEIVKGR